MQMLFPVLHSAMQFFISQISNQAFRGLKDQVIYNKADKKKWLEYYFSAQQDTKHTFIYWFLTSGPGKTRDVNISEALKEKFPAKSEILETPDWQPGKKKKYLQS